MPDNSFVSAPERMPDFPSPENAGEMAVDAARAENPSALEKKLPAEALSEALPVAVPDVASIAAKDEELVSIENELSSGLENLYAALPEDRKALFRQQGEELAVKAQTLMREARLKIGELVRLILSWLKVLPGVSSFFAEQQAVIKAQNLLNKHHHE